MENIRRLIVSVILAPTIVCASTLEGDLIQVEYLFDPGSGLVVATSEQVVVSSSEEFVCPTGGDGSSGLCGLGWTAPATFDITGSTIEFTQGGGPVFFIPAVYNGRSFSDLNFDDGSIITGVALFTNLPGLSDAQIEFGFSNVRINLQGISVAAPGNVFFTLTLQTSEPVAHASTLLTELASEVMSFNLRQGIGNALDSKLQNALRAIDMATSGDVPSAIGLMFAFMYQVEAQSGNALSPEQASHLLAQAQLIIELLEM